MESSIKLNIKIDQSELQIEKEIGHGAYGTVYKGKWNKFTNVAIKEFFQRMLTEDIECEFSREIQIMQNLKHPNIIQFYGYSLEPTRIIVELMQCSLMQFLHSKQEISLNLKLEIAQEIAAGLSYLHTNNIIHRDLKSANILLNSSKNAKICDFGLARVKLASKSLSTKKQVGTIRWMAPELFGMRPRYSIYSDIYAYGVVLWEIMSRKIPFEEVEEGELREGIKRGEREELPENYVIEEIIRES